VTTGFILLLLLLLGAPEPGEDAEFVRAKYFFRDEFLVCVGIMYHFICKTQVNCVAKFLHIPYNYFNIIISIQFIHQGKIL